MNRVIDRDRGWRNIAQKMQTFRGEAVAGFVAGKGGEVTHDGTALTMAELAAVHEFGAPSVSIPARPFMRIAVAKDQQKWIRLLNLRIKKYLVPHGSASPSIVLQPVAESMRSSIVRSITAIRIPPLKLPRRRRGSNPLIDTGALRAAINSDVRLGRFRSAPET